MTTCDNDRPLTWSSNSAWYKRSAASPMISLSDCATPASANSNPSSPTFCADPPRTLGQQFGGVAARRTRGDALCDDLFEMAQERERLRVRPGRILAPASRCASVAGGALGFGQYQQGVAVAIGGDLLELEEVAGGFALGP